MLFSTNGKRLVTQRISVDQKNILGTAFEIEYQVLEGGDLDIDFQMSSPSGTLLFNELRSEEGLHEIASAEEGDYKVMRFQSSKIYCFKNNLDIVRFVSIITFLE